MDFYSASVALLWTTALRATTPTRPLHVDRKVSPGLSEMSCPQQVRRETSATAERVGQ